MLEEWPEANNQFLSWQQIFFYIYRRARQLPPDRGGRQRHRRAAPSAIMAAKRGREQAGFE